MGMPENGKIIEFPTMEKNDGNSQKWKNTGNFQKLNILEFLVLGWISIID